MFAAGVVMAAVVAGSYLPFMEPGVLANQLESMRLYAGVFSFNAPLYYLARGAMGYQEGVTPPVDAVLMPILGLLALGVALAAALLEHGRRQRLAAAMTAALGAHLVFSSVLHPWYLLPALACAVLANVWSIRVLAMLIPFTYCFYAPDHRGEDPTVWLVQFVPFAVALGFDLGRPGIQSALWWRARSKARLIRTALSGGERILDIGGAEGYVAHRLWREGHAVTLLDVADRNRTRLPLVRYNGKDIPLADGAYDVGSVVYVLHHCHDADSVLREARRVCAKLVVIETTYATPGQRRLITFLDGLINSLRGLRPEPLDFDTPEGWKQRFTAAGWRVTDFRWLARHGYPQAWFVLERA